jgi:hypothetical protein
VYEPVKMPSKRESYPAESRGVVIIADRVVELETHHIGEAVWLATGRVSEPLPSGPACSPRSSSPRLARLSMRRSRYSVVVSKTWIQFRPRPAVNKP